MRRRPRSCSRRWCSGRRSSGRSGAASRRRLSGAVGFAALVIACPLLIRLPGRATTVAVLLAIALIATLVYLWWGTSVPGTGRLVGRGRGRRHGGGEGLAGTGAVALSPLSSGPPRSSSWSWSRPRRCRSLFNERNGVLGEGVYTNDQAAQLYWTDWLQNGVGPEPKAVQFGYPTGPQSVAAAAAEADQHLAPGRVQRPPARDPGPDRARGPGGARAPPPARRVIAASLTGLPYLAASFLAQSAFKETAMALLVLAFAVALGELGRRLPASADEPHPRRAMVVALILLVVASVFVYSLPGLAWFALAAADLARARARARAACASTSKRAREHGAPPPPGHRRRWRSW